MNNWRYGFLLLFGIILVSYGVLMMEVIENNCTLEYNDWRRRLITFVTSLMIGFGFFGLMIYTTVQHFEHPGRTLESFDFGKDRHALVTAIQVLLGIMLTVYGPLVISVILNHCDIDVKDWKKIMINGIAFLTTVFGAFLIIKPLWNKYAKDTDYSYLWSDNSTSTRESTRSTKSPSVESQYSKKYPSMTFEKSPSPNPVFRSGRTRTRSRSTVYDY